jgi:hypothetical protein
MSLRSYVGRLWMGQRYGTREHQVVYPDLALDRAGRLDRVAEVIAADPVYHIFLRVCRFCHPVLLPPHRIGPLVVVWLGSSCRWHGNRG